MNEQRTSSKIGIAALLAVLAAGAAGCAMTQQVQVTDQSYCPFFGSRVCAKLTPTTGADEVDLRWINPEAKWTRYKKVLIEPVSFWGGDDTTVSAADQRTLTNYFYRVLVEQFSQSFEVVDHPGHDVMAIHVALQDATSSSPVLRSVSVLEPHARAVATLKYLTTGTYPFVGSAQAEAKVSDSMTGQLLVAGVDKRVGGGSPLAAGQLQLGDAENALVAWAYQMATRLSSWTSGTAPS